MLRSWLGAIILRRYVTAIAARGAAGATSGSRAEGRWRRAREWLVRHGDPIVDAAIGGCLLAVPLSHEWPSHRAHFASYDRIMPMLARAFHESGLPLTIVDVGANVGDTMALVLEASNDVRFIAVEGHERFAALLRENARRLRANCIIIPSYVDDGSETAWAISLRSAWYGAAHADTKRPGIGEGQVARSTIG